MKTQLPNIIDSFFIAIENQSAEAARNSLKQLDEYLRDNASGLQDVLSHPKFLEQLVEILKNPKPDLRRPNFYSSDHVLQIFLLLANRQTVQAMEQRGLIEPIVTLFKDAAFGIYTINEDLRFASTDVNRTAGILSGFSLLASDIVVRHKNIINLANTLFDFSEQEMINSDRVFKSDKWIYLRRETWRLVKNLAERGQAAEVMATAPDLLDLALAMCNAARHYPDHVMKPTTQSITDFILNPFEKAGFTPSRPEHGVSSNFKEVNPEANSQLNP